MQKSVQSTSARVRLRNRMFGLKRIIAIETWLKCTQLFPPRYCVCKTATYFLQDQSVAHSGHQKNHREDHNPKLKTFLFILCCFHIVWELKYLSKTNRLAVQTWLLKSGPRSGDRFDMLRLPWPSSSLMFVNTLECSFCPITKCSKNSIHRSITFFLTFVAENVNVQWIWFLLDS